MTKDMESGTLRSEVLQNMNTKGTEELLRIWKRNNRKGWTAEAFEVIHDILLERLGDVPEQGAPSADDAPNENVTLDTELAENGEEGMNMFRNSANILRIASLANIASRIVLGLGVALVILSALEVLLNLQEAPPNALFADKILTILLVFSGLGSIAITWGVSFIILQAISQGLYLFLDIEKNRRPAKQDGD